MLKPSVQISDKDGVWVAEFWDCLRLDPTPIQELHKKFEARVNAGGRADLVIDLSGVSFAGSMALGVFLKIHRLASPHGGEVVFCRVEDDVREVFKVSRVEHLFRFAGDVDEALALLKQPRPAPSPTSANPDGSPSAPKPPRAPSPLRRSRKSES